MNIIDIKLIDAYATLVLAERYIISEDNRIDGMQQLVPQKYKEQVGIKVAEKTIEALSVTSN